MQFGSRFRALRRICLAMNASVSSQPSSAETQATHVGEHELYPGMSVRLRGLRVQVGLNGCWGTLVKFETDRDRWQVDLGVERGIVLLRTCNLSASQESEDLSDCASQSVPPQTQTRPMDTAMHASASDQPSSSEAQGMQLGGDELYPGMSVRLRSLRFLGCRGTLVRFDTEWDRWQVD